MATDAATVADIVHHDVSGYESFDTITPMVVESDGDGAGFKVHRNGEWYDVTIRPGFGPDECAECGQTEASHAGTESEFVQAP